MSEEEIDIVELLKRIREDKAPKRIEINGKVYVHTLYEFSVGVMYVEENNMSAYWELNNYMIDTKIKILDKPIIEELDIKLDDTWAHNLYMFEIKINEIIKHINEEEK